MTPKEEAKELVDNFLPFVDWNDLQDDCTNRDWAIRNAKKCALIAVDKIIYSYPTDPFNTLQPTGITPFNYWREVKQEIELL